MIRIGAISDSHFDATRRLEDAIEIHAEFVRQAHAARVDLIVHAGDLFERRSTPADRNAAAEFIMEAAAIAPVVLVRGNHDAEGDLDIMEKLDTTFPVEVFTSPGNTISPVANADTDLRVIALPWFDKAQLVAGVDAADAEQDATTNRTIVAARAMLRGLAATAAATLDANLIPILVGHVQVAGSETSTGQTLIGQTVELTPYDIAEIGCSVAIVGHIHKHQSWLDGRVVYPGSPLRQNFGEAEAKGWCLIEIDPAAPDSPNVVFMPLPARDLVLIEHDGTTGERVEDFLSAGISRGDWPGLTGGLVRVRYRVRVEDLARVDEEQLAACLRSCGAHEVKLEAIVQAETRARCAEIVAAVATWDKVRAYLQAKSITLPDAQIERLRAKLAEIEQPAGAASEAA